jgi:hypothetical protein
MHSCRGFKCIFATQNISLSAAFQRLCKKCSRPAKITHLKLRLIRVHFTTKEVLSVKLGILKRGLSWEQIFKMQKSNQKFS